MSADESNCGCTPKFSFAYDGGLLKVAGAFVLSFLAMSVVGLLSITAQSHIVSLLGLSKIDPQLIDSFGELFVYVPSFLVGILVLRAFTRERNLLSTVGLTFATLRARFKWIALTSVLWYIIAVVTIALSYWLLPLPAPYSPAGDAAKDMTGLSFGIFAMLAVVAAPLFEELLYRGLLQNMLRSALRRFSDKHAGKLDVLAVVIAAALFAGMHGTLTGFPVLFILGLAMGEAYRRSGTLWASIGVHFLNNLVVTLLMMAS